MDATKAATWTIEGADRMTQAEMFGEVLTRLAEENTKIVALTADVAVSTKIARFQKRFPERFFDFGIAENNMFAAAAGLAATGLVPVISTFAVFASLRSAEFVRTSLCYQKCNVKIVGTHSGTSFGQGGTTHHCTEDFGVLRSFPYMTVIAPADAYETARAVMAALETDLPVYIRIGRGPEPPLHINLDFDFTIGRAITLHDGADATVIATGRTVAGALKAAKAAKRDGISLRVLNMHTIKPIDEAAILQAVRDTRRIITVEDHNVIGGLGSAVAEVIARHNKACVLCCLGLQDEFSIVGSADELLHVYQLDADGILEKVREVVKGENEF